jgi:D-alanyl-D-alanine carboxypeptidase/D-alanyl-D-alanine-endopeptidase (penicillin-binding protein 4)
VIRRLIVPVLLIAVAIGAALQARSADEDSDPGIAPSVGPPDFVVGTPMLSVRRTPEWLRQPLADNLLANEVRAANLTRVTPPDTCIVTHRDGEEIASIKGDFLLVPASNQKILTAAAILELAPATDTFTTEVVYRRDTPISELVEGTEEQGRELQGDLWLIGGGDPVLSTPAYVDRYQEPRAHTDFTVLADSVASELTALGITTVTGGIVADETRFPSERDYTQELWPSGEFDENNEPIQVPIWKEEFVQENQVGPLSALLLNDGYTTWPEDPEVPGARAQNARAGDPALAAADTLRDLLAERGIEVQGASRSELAPLLPERNSLGSIESPPLSEIVARMLTHSDNTTAEMLLKEIGVRTGETGARLGAVQGLRSALLDAGYPVTNDMVFADGSGLSSLNETRCTLIIDILDDAGPDSPLIQGMAVVGETGTLRACLATRTDVDDVAAKTGTLNDVTALSGMTVADNGDVITFAMLANGEGVGVTLGTCDLNAANGLPVNEIQLALIDAVIGHPYGPALDDLAPLNAVGG